jgi:predicted phage tail protein
LLAFNSNWQYGVSYFGGVAQLISPTPSMGSFTSGKEAARLESFSFSGIVNTSASKEWQSQFAMAVHLLALL